MPARDSVSGLLDRLVLEVLLSHLVNPTMSSVALSEIVSENPELCEINNQSIDYSKTLSCPFTLHSGLLNEICALNSYPSHKELDTEKEVSFDLTDQLRFVVAHKRIL